MQKVKKGDLKNVFIFSWFPTYIVTYSFSRSFIVILRLGSYMSLLKQNWIELFNSSWLLFFQISEISSDKILYQSIERYFRFVICYLYFTKGCTTATYLSIERATVLNIDPIWIFILHQCIFSINTIPFQCELQGGCSREEMSPELSNLVKILAMRTASKKSPNKPHI